MHDIILGIEYLQLNRIVHCDIKPENLLLTTQDINGTSNENWNVSTVDDSSSDGKGGGGVIGSRSRLIVKIADFGSAYIVNKHSSPNNDDFVSRYVGSTEYAAPETLKPPFLAWQVDIWAIGVTLFEMISGINLFASKNALNVADVLDRIQTLNIEKTIKDYIKNCNDKNITDNWDNHLTHFLLNILNRDVKKRLTINDIKKHPWITATLQTTTKTNTTKANKQADIKSNPKNVNVNGYLVELKQPAGIAMLKLNLNAPPTAAKVSANVQNSVGLSDSSTSLTPILMSNASEESKSDDNDDKKGRDDTEALGNDSKKMDAIKSEISMGDSKSSQKKEKQNENKQDNTTRPKRKKQRFFKGVKRQNN